MSQEKKKAYDENLSYYIKNEECVEEELSPLERELCTGIYPNQASVPSGRARAYENFPESTP